MTRPPGVILAGGRATRMGGGDKGLLRLGQRRLIDHVIDRVAPQVTRIALNANGDASRFEDFGLPVLADSIGGFAGPLAGVLAALDWASEDGAATVVTVAADTPFFPTDLVVRLQTEAGDMEHPLVLAATPGRNGRPGRHPTFGLWPVALRDDLRSALAAGVRKVVHWTDQHGTRTALFDGDDDPFFNVNTPEDLARATERAAVQR
ncbi:MAG: molybdenum cofactor guanylyltransferase MobA [Pseudomonadota bacterium]